MRFNSLTKEQKNKWRRTEASKLLWKDITETYRPYEMLRQCDADKIEYYRCMADMMEEFKKIFEIEDI